jgi:hypothetical protein
MDVIELAARDPHLHEGRHVLLEPRGRSATEAQEELIVDWSLGYHPEPSLGYLCMGPELRYRPCLVYGESASVTPASRLSGTAQLARWALPSERQSRPDKPARSSP